MPDKKKIKINFLDFWDDFNKNDNIFVDILKKHYDVEISSNPDFLFVTYMHFVDRPYEYTEYDCVRILVSWDALYPDFNTFDYAITNFKMECGDRHLWYPYGFVDVKKIRKLESDKRSISDDILAEKVNFCDFIYSHSDMFGAWRDKAYDAFNEYRPVLSAGSYRNNMPKSEKVTMTNKFFIQKTCKFSIAFEGFSERGYISEKIFDAYRANTIPIYYGNSETVKDILNPKSYINISDYGNDMKKVLDRVKYLDSNDDRYISMLNEPVFINHNYFDEMYSKLEKFLVHIFDQDSEKAVRRIKGITPRTQEILLNNYYKFRTQYKPVYWTFKVIEKIKSFLKK